MKIRSQQLFNITDAMLIIGHMAFLMVYFDIRYLFYDTVVTGGDTASWHGVAHHLSEVLLPSGRLTGWDMGNFCGYPNFNFYFLPPFLIAVLPTYFFGIPLTITLKLAIMSGIFLFPIAAYFGLRSMNYRFPIPIIGAAGAVLLLFNESYTMFGGNALSTFAGEFCYMFAFAIFAYFIGSFYHGYKRDTRAIKNGIILGLIGLSHLFVFIPALILLVHAFFDRAKLRYLLYVSLTAFACMAFWILPLIAFRHPYTTPVYMIWQEFVNLRYTMAGIVLLIICIGPKFVLLEMNQREKLKKSWRLAFVIFSAAGGFAVAYLVGEYLVLGKNLWYTGLNFPEFSASPLGELTADLVNPLILPFAVAVGIAAGVLGLRAQRFRFGSGLFAKFCMANQSHPDRFFIFLSLVFGCVVAYFSAHFLQVPDIRFLPPIIYAFFLIICAETVGPFIIKKSMIIRAAFAVTACYLALIAVIFGSSMSDSWYRFNNRGYESTSGNNDFAETNRYLRTVYSKSGLDPLNAPRVAYEKCDLYGSYGGDRVFESLPFFSGRQTLEGIHYAGSIASRCIAFLQTEFSRDIKTPSPQILSKMNPEVLPAHFDLYNISQLVVMTDKAKKAMSRSPWFEKEAAFGEITLFRYTKCDGRYVDIPKVRPVLYTGEKWSDDFFEWYKDPNLVDVLFVPERFVKDEEDRAAFAGRIDTIVDLDRFRSNTPDCTGLKIDSHLEHLQIRFTTNKTGVPHLIKVSYFPNWKVRGANGVYPVSPHLMLVIPREKEVVLTYERSSWEIVGLCITCTLIVFLFAKWILRFTGILSEYQQQLKRKWGRIWEFIEQWVNGTRHAILGLIIICTLSLIIAGAIYRNKPVRTYVAGYREYKIGSRLYHEGKEQSAAKHFVKAIRIMKPLLDKRRLYDHRDVINSLLFTAASYENMGEYEKAISWYQTILREYPYSRYVGEGYVKIARIYKQQMEPVWREGLNKLRQGSFLSGKKMVKDGLAIMEKSLRYYNQAIRNDSYSVWANYAVSDLKNEQKFLDKAQKDLFPLCKDSELKQLMESLRVCLKSGNRS